MKNLDLRPVAKHFEDKLKKIKILLFDVDGILTDGRLFYVDEKMTFNRFFNAQDGYGLVMMKKLGFKVGIITGGNSHGVLQRSKYLNLDHCHYGSEDKRKAFEEIRKKENCTFEEMLYMGDEFFDLPLLKKAGFSATVPNCSIEVRESVDYITSKEGGEGAAREVMDLVRHAHGLTPDIEYFS